MLVGIIGAMDLEVQALKGLMDNAVVETISTIDFYKGNINGVETVVAVAGVGKVNAAVCSQTMILKYSPDIMINVGVAGGLSEEFKIGDIAVADSVVEHDMDTSPIGDPVGLISGINLVNIPCDKKLADLMEQAVSKVGTISDGANDDSHMDYPEFAKMAAANSIKIILELLNSINGGKLQ